MDGEFDFDAGDPDLDDLPGELRLAKGALFVEGYMDWDDWGW